MLIDTHILIWLALQPSKLSTTAENTIQANKNQLIIADISLWEIAMLIEKGRLQVDVAAQQFLELAIHAFDLQVQPITPQIAVTATTLPDSVNKDPADRLIMAAAMVLGVPLVTADANLRKASIVEVVWL